MFPRKTNPSDINKPVIGTLNLDQKDDSEDLYKVDYDLTRKKSIILAAVISAFSIALITVLYCGLFVLDYNRIPAKSMSASKFNISSNNILSFQIKCTDYQLSDSSNIEIIEDKDGIIYVTVKQPIIPKKASSKTNQADLYKNFQIDVTGVSSVYYVGDNEDEKLLIWKR